MPPIVLFFGRLCFTLLYATFFRIQKKLIMLVFVQIYAFVLKCPTNANSAENSAARLKEWKLNAVTTKNPFFTKLVELRIRRDLGALQGSSGLAEAEVVERNRKEHDKERGSRNTQTHPRYETVLVR